jgi:hypothetical protein
MSDERKEREFFQSIPIEENLMNHVRTRAKLIALATVCTWTLAACGAAESGFEGAEGDGMLGVEVEELIAECSSGKLGPALNSHACWHGPNGPYANVTASDTAPGDDSFGGIHTYYTVDFEDTTSTYVGYVTFEPDNNDDHAIYFDPSVTVTVKTAGGSTVSHQLSQSFSACPGDFTGYRTFYLSSSGAPYSIKLQSATTPVNVLLEEVTPYRQRWYQDADDDTWGKPTPNVLTACEPPAGYDVTRGSDCNDANASVYPLAPETPSDGIDSNCNGQDNT